MAGQRLVNVGTKEAPVLVPADVSLKVDSVESRQWWEMLATGSVAVSNEVLSNLVGTADEKERGK